MKAFAKGSLPALVILAFASPAMSQDSRTISRPGVSTSLVQNVQIVGDGIAGSLTATPTATHTPTPGGIAVFTFGTATPTQTPFAVAHQTNATAATSSEAWTDLWPCAGNSYTFVFSGTISQVAYSVYVANGTAAPSAGATNGVLLTGPITITAASTVAIDPKWRYVNVALSAFSGATTVTASGFCNNFR